MGCRTMSTVEASKLIADRLTVSVAPSADSSAATSPSVQSALGASDSGSGASVTSRLPSVARARCSALFTEATEVSRLSAISAADQPTTSARSSTARCFGGRC